MERKIHITSLILIFLVCIFFDSADAAARRSDRITRGKSSTARGGKSGNYTMPAYVLSLGAGVFLPGDGSAEGGSLDMGESIVVNAFFPVNPPKTRQLKHLPATWIGLSYAYNQADFLKSNDSDANLNSYSMHQFVLSGRFKFPYTEPGPFTLYLQGGAGLFRSKIGDDLNILAANDFGGNFGVVGNLSNFFMGADLEVGCLMSYIINDNSENMFFTAFAAINIVPFLGYR